MITKSTYLFLEQLATNNNREWFSANKAGYEAARENVLEFTQSLIRVLSHIDVSIPAELDAKKCVMRIYRDIRFSKDKTPFKTNFGIAISPTGKNFNGPGYYFHIESGKSFLAGGCWMPEKELLKAIRQEIDYNSSEFHSVIDNEKFKTTYGVLSQEDKLKTSPKGYASDHDHLEYLKLKSYTVSRLILDNAFTERNFEKQIQDYFQTLLPFIHFLRSAIS